MEQFYEFMAIVYGLHALVGVFIFFGGLCVFGGQAVIHITRERQQAQPSIRHIYIENLHIYVNPQRSRADHRQPHRRH